MASCCVTSLQLPNWGAYTNCIVEAFRTFFDHLSCVASYPEAFRQLLNELVCVCDPWNWCWLTKLRSCSFGNMPRLFKRSHRYNVAKNCFLARIILLDNTNIEFNLLPEVTGADCLEKVAQVLVIQEVSPPRLSVSWERRRRRIHFLRLPSSVLLGHGGCVMPCAVKDGVRRCMKECLVCETKPWPCKLWTISTSVFPHPTPYCCTPTAVAE